MNRAWLFLPILLLAGRAGVAADMSVPATVRVVQTPQIPFGPLGACRIYVQGRYATCEVTTEPVCQRLSELRYRPRFAVASRRWYALPQGLAWDMPGCAPEL